MAAIAAWFETLNERERRLIVIAAAVAAAVLLFALLSLDRDVARAAARVAHKQQDLAWMQSVAPRLAAAGPPAAAPASQRSLIVIVDASAREAGLGSSLTRSDPSPQGGLSVHFEKASFDALVGWIARLSQQNRISVESANIDDAGAPGLVNAALVLRASS